MTKTSAVIATKLLLDSIRRFFPALLSHLRDLVCDSSLKIAVLFFTFSAFFFGSLHTHVSPTQDSCLDFYTAYISQRSRRQDSFPLYGTNTERTVSTTFSTITVERHSAPPQNQQSPPCVSFEQWHTSEKFQFNSTFCSRSDNGLDTLTVSYFLSIAESGNVK